jgi:acyl carrier protein
MSKLPEQRVQDVFRRVFDLPQLIVTAEMTAADVDAWNSFTHMLLVAEIESEFGIKFNFEEVRAFNCVGDMLMCIESKTKHG